MRLDKYLCQLNIGSRNEVKQLIRKGQITVNGSCITLPEYQVSESHDRVAFQGNQLSYKKNVYYMMNKPGNVVCATTDAVDKTVLQLLLPVLPKEDRGRTIAPVGRLDKDTTGLLFLTDDGALAHELLSPKKHVDKTYLVELEHALSIDEIHKLEEGIDIGENKLTLPARVDLLSPDLIQLTIHEGRYHQVKRMMQSIGNKVLSLKRLRFGSLQLDPGLSPGESRPLTEKELESLKERESCPVPDAKLLCKEIDAIIFDLDGTLVDSMWMWHQIDVEYLGNFQIPLPSQLQQEIEGKSFHETAVYFKEHFPIPQTIEEMKSTWNHMAWDKYEHQVPLKPGAYEFLKFCRQRGMKLGIATSNSRELVTNILDTHGLHDYFSSIKTGSEVINGKPAPDIYLAVAEELQCPPERCLVFEDILPGIAAGKRAGMKVCAVEDLYSQPVCKEKKEKADYYIKDYREIQFGLEESN